MKIRLKNIIYALGFTIFATAFIGCSTTRKKKEVKGFKKFYHNTTAKFNGYFNAEELMKESMVQLQDMHVDNYNGILSVYDYTAVENPQSVKADMDKAIEKLSTVATIHDVSNYVDDCYLNIGKAQFFKQDYIAAEETFLYFEEVFDPKNPFGRAYDSKAYKSSSKKRKTKKEINQERKEKEKERKEKKKEKEEERKEKEKTKKEKDKERKEARKQREKEAKERKKNRSKKRRPKTKKEEPTKKVETTKSEPKELTPEQIALAEQKAIQQQESEEEAKRRKKLEEEKKKKKEKEEEKYKNQGEGAIFKNKSAYTEGLYWLARTYIETGRYAAADYAFKRLDETPGLKEKVANKIPAAKAHLYLKTKEYDMALLELESAIELEKNRNLRARYAFIKAQIHEKKENPSSAYEEYNRSKKFATDYEMDLNAKLNEVKLSYTKEKSSKKALAKLEKMLDEGKNKSFQDQIYFAMGTIKLDAGDIEGAKADFETSIASAGSNQNVKLEAYYKLASLLFEEGYYADSKSNYDSALKIMKKSDERYKQVERLSKSLTEIADNINTVELQDSLLRMSTLTEDELQELAEKVVLENRENATSEDEKLGANTRKPNVISSNRQLGSGRSNFFAYNPITLNQGKVEFNRTWGDRSMEDNWRRSLRSNANQSSTDFVYEENSDPEEVTDEEIREVLRDIPRNDNQISAANARIEKALFSLGTLFRERIRNYPKSIEVLERLKNEYPNFVKRDEALFYLYLSYLDMENGPKANDTKALLIAEFPNSKFARLAKDPSYALTLKENEDNIETYYEATYDLFNKGEYQVVVDRISEKDKLYNRSKKYAAKFSLLNAMSLGSLKGKTDYVQALEQVIRSYPNSPEEIRAKEILRFLKGDQDAFNEILFDEAVEAFEDDPEKLHYVFIVTYGLDQLAFDKAKIEVLNYNKKFHRFDNLKLSNIYLNQENKARIILIRSFDNKDKAFKYCEGVGKNKELFIKDTELGYDIFATTQRNYREVIKQKSITNYKVFYQNNYEK